MVAFIPVGRPPLQLLALNQLEDIAPVQLVWARVDTVDAEINAITAVVVSKCVRIDAPRANRIRTSSKPSVIRASLLLFEDWSQRVSAGPRRFDSCGFSATLSSALLMTHNQLPRLVCIDAKVAVQRVN
jgi:hypothetical protein